MPTYQGRCHCGALKFTLQSDAIADCVRCNCSICARKGAVMSTAYYPPESISVEGLDRLTVYRFGDRLVNHYFCPTCGVYPFHDGTERPGHFRVNLGCIDGVDPLTLPVRVIDGKSF